MRTLRKILIGALGLLLCGGIYWAGRRADRAFLKYWEGGGTEPKTLFEIAPQGVEQKVYSLNLGKFWKTLRTSEQGKALLETSALQKELGRWGISGKDPSPFEMWCTEYWSREVLWAADREKKVAYLLTPLGTRGDCFRWLTQMFLSSVGKHIDWIPIDLHGRKIFRAKDSSFWPEGLNVEFCFLQGIAVLGLGLGEPPLEKFLIGNKTLTHQKETSPEVSHFIEFQTTQKSGIIGAHREKGEDPNALVIWTLSDEPQGNVRFQMELPVSSKPASSLLSEAVHPWAKFQRTDDQIALWGSLDQMKWIWDEFHSRFPTHWVELLRSLDRSTLLGSYQEIWEPVIKKLGNEVYLSFGEGREISSKYQIPLPETIFAIPMGDRAAVIQALEATVLRLNRDEQANLVLRKTVHEYGELYEPRMGPSSWKNKHGLEVLPVIGFIEDYLVIGLDAASFLSLCDHLVANKEKLPVTLEPGVHLRVKLKDSPQTIRVLLGVLGVMTSQEENMILTPQVMKSLDEWLEVIRKYRQIDFRLNPKDSGLLLDAYLEL